MIRGLLAGLLLLGLVPMVAAQTSIQYQLSTGQVTGTRATPIEAVPGYGVVVSPTTPPPWPVPAGCTATSGQADWTVVTDPGLVTAGTGGLGLTPAYAGFFFSTTSPLLPGCHLVLQWGELKRLYRDTIIEAVQGEDFTFALDALNAWVDGTCPASQGSANCVTSRANRDTLNQDFPGSGQLLTLTTDAVTLRTDVWNFKASKGW